MDSLSVCTAHAMIISGVSISIASAVKNSRKNTAVQSCKLNVSIISVCTGMYYSVIPRVVWNS
jgi:hypothetical protein